MSDGIDREVYRFNYWPSSQLCMDCKHGAFVMEEGLPASTYTCSEGIDLGPCESSCPFFEQSEESKRLESLEKEPKPERFLANDPIEW